MAYSKPADSGELELAARDSNPKELYFLLTALVIPRPIAWVSSIAPDGRANLAPYSYFNAVANDPPYVMFSSVGCKDSLRNIKATGEFVLNIVPMTLSEQMNFTAADFPPEYDEFERAGLTAVSAKTVAAARVGEAKAHLECVLDRVVEIGNGRVVFGRVTHIHVAAELWDGPRIDPYKLAPVCRLGGSYYAGLGEIYKLERPTWEGLKAAAKQGPMPR